MTGYFLLRWKLEKEMITLIPEYKTAGSSGMDISPCLEESIMLYSGSTTIINTGLEFQIPEGFEIQIRPRSGLAANNQITVLNSPGTIDSSYTGEVKVILINLGSKTFKIDHGMRIAQIVLAPVTKAEIEIVIETRKTDRGEGGLGSTGVKWKLDKDLYQIVVVQVL